MCNSNWCTFYMASYTDEHSRVKGHKVTSTVTDPKFLSINIASPSKNILTDIATPYIHTTLTPSPSQHTYSHTHITTHSPTQTHTDTSTHPPPYTHTQHIHPHTHTSTSTQDLPVSWGDSLCSCCLPVEPLSCCNPSHQNTTILSHRLNRSL